MSLAYNIKGLQEAQQRNQKRIVELGPQGAIGDTIIWAVENLNRKLMYNTPRDTGALKATRRITLNLAELQAIISNDGNSYNPKSKTPPHVYDVYLHKRGYKPGLRGGIQASMPYTVETEGGRIQTGALQRMVKALELR